MRGRLSRKTTSSMKRSDEPRCSSTRDQAMAMLRDAVAKGYKDAAHDEDGQRTSIRSGGARISRRWSPNWRRPRKRRRRNRKSASRARPPPRATACSQPRRTAGEALPPDEPLTAPALGLPAGNDVPPFHRRPTSKGRTRHVVPQLVARSPIHPCADAAAKAIAGDGTHIEP